jgi:hypothetical protein
MLSIGFRLSLIYRQYFRESSYTYDHIHQPTDAFGCARLSLLCYIATDLGTHPA